MKRVLKKNVAQDPIILQLCSRRSCKVKFFRIKKLDKKVGLGRNWVVCADWKWLGKQEQEQECGQ